MKTRCGTPSYSECHFWRIFLAETWFLSSTLKNSTRQPSKKRIPTRLVWPIIPALVDQIAICKSFSSAWHKFFYEKNASLNLTPFNFFITCFLTICVAQVQLEHRFKSIIWWCIWRARCALFHKSRLLQCSFLFRARSVKIWSSASIQLTNSLKWKSSKKWYSRTLCRLDMVLSALSLRVTLKRQNCHQAETVQKMRPLIEDSSPSMVGTVLWLIRGTQILSIRRGVLRISEQANSTTNGRTQRVDLSRFWRKKSQKCRLSWKLTKHRLSKRKNSSKHRSRWQNLGLNKSLWMDLRT